jgi:hypothetical protein
MYPAVTQPSAGGTLFTRRSRAQDEQRIHDFLAAHGTVSETSISLARKLRVDVNTTREVLEDLVENGELRRRVFPDIEPIYFRYPSLDDA